MNLQQTVHPRVLINIMIINKSETKILFVKRHNKQYFELLGQVLEYGQTFLDCVKETMRNETNMKIDENDSKDDYKFRYICSYNAIDKEKRRHFVEINYAIKVDEDEKIYVNKNKFWYKWMSMEDMKNPRSKLFYGFQIFLEKYNVKDIKDILKIKAI